MAFRFVFVFNGVVIDSANKFCICVEVRFRGNGSTLDWALGDLGPKPTALLTILVMLLHFGFHFFLKDPD